MTMDSDIKIIISGDFREAGNGLSNFIEKNNQVFHFEDLRKSDEYSQLWKALTTFICNPKAKEIHTDVLNAIRVLSRDKEGLDDVMDEELLNALLEYSGITMSEIYADPQQQQIALDSLKCLCNILFNSKVARAICSKNSTLQGIINRVKKSSVESVPEEMFYFDVKILFIMTALCSELRQKLREHMDGITYLIDALDNTLKHTAPTYSSNCTKLSDMQINIVTEILKVLFNLTCKTNFGSNDPEEMAQCENLVTILSKYLTAPCDTLAKKYELVNHISNLLTNLPTSTYKNLYVPAGQEAIPDHLRFEDLNMEAIYEILQFLARCMSDEPTVGRQNEILSPVLMTLLQGATVSRPIRKYLRMQILPPLKDVRQRPEQGNTLRNCMCRLLTTPITQVRDFAAELLFVLCKENVNRMIKYTGYGNAAGLFANRGLLGGQSGDTSAYSSESDDSDTEEYKDMKHGINPVLGCYQSPLPNPTANMTEEQKEYEAMKLVELMDSLTRTGIVRPCKIGPDGRPTPVEHILELQVGKNTSQNKTYHNDSD